MALGESMGGKDQSSEAALVVWPQDFLAAILEQAVPHKESRDGAIVGEFNRGQPRPPFRLLPRHAFSNGTSQVERHSGPVRGRWLALPEVVNTALGVVSSRSDGGSKHGGHNQYSHVPLY